MAFDLLEYRRRAGNAKQTGSTNKKTGFDLLQYRKENPPSKAPISKAYAGTQTVKPHAERREDNVRLAGNKLKERYLERKIEEQEAALKKERERLNLLGQAYERAYDPNMERQRMLTMDPTATAQVLQNLQPIEKQRKLIEDLQGDITKLKDEKYYTQKAGDKLRLGNAAQTAEDFASKAAEGKQVKEVKFLDNRAAILANINADSDLVASAKTADHPEALQQALKWRKATGEEANILRYYYAKGDNESFDKYKDALSRELDKRYVEDLNQKHEKTLDKLGAAGKVIAGTEAVARSFVTPAAYLQNLGQLAKNAITGEHEPTNLYSTTQQSVSRKAAAQEYVLKDANETVKFLGNVGFSIADMATKFPFGAAVSLAYMSSGAAGQATNDALQRGASPEQAATIGTLAGAIEYVTEKLPIDNLFKIAGKLGKEGAEAAGKLTLKTAIKNTLQQAGIEASEELVSEYANTLADMAIMGKNSEYERRKAQLMESGMGEAEAIKQANHEFFIMQPLMAAAGGAVSGGVMGGGANVFNALSARAERTGGRETGQNTRQGINMPIDQSLVKQAQARPGEAQKPLFIPNSAENATPAAQNGQAGGPDSFGPNTVGVAERTQRLTNDELVQKYGALPQGGEPRARDVSIAAETPGGKTSRWSRTVAESGVADDVTVDQIKAAVENGTLSYVPVSDAFSLREANRRISGRGIEKAQNDFTSAMESGRRLYKEDIVTGERLIQEAVKRGDYETATQLIIDVATLGTELGQQVQALSIIKKLTPEGQLMTLTRAVERMNGQFSTSKNKKAAKVKLSISEADAANILSQTTPEGLDQAVTNAQENIAAQIPPQLSDKIRSWRYLAMLGNPRTHIRNIVSNVAMAFTRKAKNTVGAAIESGVNLFAKDMERTKTLKPASKEAQQFARKDAAEMRDTLTSGGKLGISTSTIRQMVKPFKDKGIGKALNWASKANNGLLEVEDWWFLRGAYIDSLQQYMTANKLSAEHLQSGTRQSNESLQKARQYATEEALKATFRDASALAAGLNRIENTNAATKIIIGGLIPFKKTPINIVKRGVEYSPIGLVDAVTRQSAKLAKGDITAAQYIDRLSSGLTGSGIMFLGYMLAKMALLRGSSEEKWREEAYAQAQGAQPYSIEIGGNTYTLDWLSPAAMPMMAGVELYNATSSMGEDFDFNRFVDALSKTVDPLNEMSMLQGINDALGSYNQDDALGSLGNLAISTGESYVTQMIPTVAGQIARTIDDTRRTTYSAKDTDFPFGKAGETLGRRVMAKLPIASKYLEPYVDVWGREEKRTSNIPLRAAENAMFPWYGKVVQPTAVDNEINRLYKQLGETDIIPAIPSGYITLDKERYDLKPKEYTTYKKTVGQESYKTLESLIASDAYKKLDDTDKRTAVKKAYDYAREVAKLDYAVESDIDWEPDTAPAKMMNAVAAGIPAGTYITASMLFNGIEADKDSEGNAISGTASAKKAHVIMGLDIADKQKEVLLKQNNIKQPLSTLNALKSESNYKKWFSASDERKKAIKDAEKQGIPFSTAFDTLDRVSKMEARKDQNGKGIAYDKAHQVFAYLYDLPLDAEQKEYLFRAAGYDYENYVKRYGAKKNPYLKK